MTIRNPFIIHYGRTKKFNRLLNSINHVNGLLKYIIIFRNVPRWAGRYSIPIMWEIAATLHFQLRRLDFDRRCGNENWTETMDRNCIVLINCRDPFREWNRVFFPPRRGQKMKLISQFRLTGKPREIKLKYYVSRIQTGKRWSWL